MVGRGTTSQDIHLYNPGHIISPTHSCRNSLIWAETQIFIHVYLTRIHVEKKGCQHMLNTAELHQ